MSKNILKKISYLLVLIIIICLILISNANYKKYEMCVAGNDQLSLIYLNDAIEELIVYHSKDELTQIKYQELRNQIKMINQYIWRSDNLHFMNMEVDQLIDINDKDEFVKIKMDNCIKLNNKMEDIFKEEHDAMLLYMYFKDKDNRIDFKSLFD